jgi:hypothetical protein
MGGQHMLVCMTCHAYGSNPVELASWSGREDYCDWHNRVRWMTEEEYCAWADARSMDHDDGGQ